MAVLAGLAVIGPARAEEPADPLVEPIEVRKVYGDGRHNAFTALARFNGLFWLAFRSGKDHNSPDGEILLLESADAKDWKESRRFNAGPDDRDPQFLVAGKRLPLRRGRGARRRDARELLLVARRRSEHLRRPRAAQSRAVARLPPSCYGSAAIWLVRLTVPARVWLAVLRDQPPARERPSAQHLDRGRTPAPQGPECPSRWQ